MTCQGWLGFRGLSLGSDEDFLRLQKAWQKLSKAQSESSGWWENL